MERLACGPEAFEVPRCADRGRDAEGVELASERGTRFGDGEYDAPRLELARKLGERLAARVVDVVDRDCVEDEPDRRMLDVYEPEHLLREALRVRVEEADAEAV